jgi:hypothetical protein
MALAKRHGHLTGKESDLSVAFTKEDSAETASETLLPDRPVSPHPNLVTEAGLKALELQLQQAREAYQTAQTIEDVNERRRQAATPLRDVRYFAARVRTAQVIADPTSTDTVAFGSTVTFRRDDGRVWVSGAYQSMSAPAAGFYDSGRRGPFLSAMRVM